MSPITQPIIIRSNAKEVAANIQRQAAEMPKATREAAKEIERETLRDLRRTVSTWRRQPPFETVYNAMPGAGFEMMIGTDDAVWQMLDQGTREHFIFPRRKRALAFPTAYRAKTAPGILNSTIGGASGPTIVRAWVLHPGTKPRKWTEKLVDLLKTRVPDTLQRAIQRWNR